MIQPSTRTKVAVACQGGGSQTAFTAGALRRILRDHDLDRSYELVALSGTSGGALCCLLAWYGLLVHADDPEHRGGRAAELLTAFWQENAAHDVWDLLVLNPLIVGLPPPGGRGMAASHAATGLGARAGPRPPAGCGLCANSPSQYRPPPTATAGMSGGTAAEASTVDDLILVWFGVSITDRGPASVGTAAMAFGWDASPVDYRDDELDVVGDGDDLGIADLDDLGDLDDD